MVLNVKDAAMGVVAVERPDAEETVKVPAGQPVRIAFDAGSSTMTVENGDLVVRFPDGATIVFEGAGLQLAEAGQTPPQGAPGKAQLAQGLEPGGAEGVPPAKLPDLLELSERELEQLLQIEPAAGATDPDEGDQEVQGNGGDFEAPGLSALEGLSTLGLLSGESEDGSPLPDPERGNASAEPGDASAAGNSPPSNLPSDPPSDPPAASPGDGSPNSGVEESDNSPDLSGGQTPPPPQAANPEEESPGEGNPGAGNPSEGNPSEGNPGEGGPGEGGPGEGGPGEGGPGEGGPGEGGPGEGGPVGDSEEQPDDVVEAAGPGNGNGNGGNPGNGGGNTGGSGPGSGNGGTPPGQIEDEDSDSIAADSGGPGNGNGNTPNSGNGGGNTEGSGPGSGNGGTPPGQSEDQAAGPSDELVGAALQTLGEEPLLLVGFDIAAPEEGGSMLDLSEVIADYDSSNLTYLLQRDGRGWDIAVQVESGSEEGGPVTLAVIDGDSLTDGGASVNLNPSFDAADALADNIQLSITGG